MSLVRLGAKVALASLIKLSGQQVAAQRCHTFNTMLQYRFVDGQLQLQGISAMGRLLPATKDCTELKKPMSRDKDSLKSTVIGYIPTADQQLREKTFWTCPS